MRKRILLACAALWLIVACAAWSAGQDEGTNKAFTLTVWMWDHPPIQEIVTNIVIPAFEAEYPYVTVKYDIPDSSQDGEHKKMVIAGQANALPDVAALGAGYLAEHIYLKNVEPLDFDTFGVSSMEEFGNLYDGGQSVARWGDTFYGVPLSVATYSMILNKEHFRESGLDPENGYPLTWLEGDRSMAAVGKKLVRTEGDTIIREGYGLATHPVGSLINYYNVLGSQGVELITPDGKSTNFESPESVRVLETYRDLVFRHKVSAPGGSGRSALKREAFQNGTASIMSTIWSWYLGVIDDYPDVWKGGEGVKFFPFPLLKGASPYSDQFGSLWVTTTGSKHKKEAWAFQKVCMEHAEDFMATGLMQPIKGWENFQSAKDMMQFETFREIIAYPGSMQLMTSEVGAIWGKALTKVVFENDDIPGTLATANKELENYLKKLPYSPQPEDKLME